MKCLNIFAGCIAILILPSCSFAASFDCNKASTRIEHAICGNAKLSELDSQLGDTYKKALSLSALDQNGIRDSQRLWIKDEQSSCKDIQCLQSAYEVRLRELEQEIQHATTARLPVPVVKDPDAPAQALTPSGTDKSPAVALASSLPVVVDVVSPLPAANPTKVEVTPTASGNAPSVAIANQQETFQVGKIFGFVISGLLIPGLFIWGLVVLVKKWVWKRKTVDQAVPTEQVPLMGVTENVSEGRFKNLLKGSLKWYLIAAVLVAGYKAIVSKEPTQRLTQKQSSLTQKNSNMVGTWNCTIVAQAIRSGDQRKGSASFTFDRNGTWKNSAGEHGNYNESEGEIEATP